MSAKRADELVSKLTGLSVQDVRQAFADAQANGKRLDACAGPHDFGAFVPLQRVYTCARCGGTVHHSARHWYNIGLAHAGRA